MRISDMKQEGDIWHITLTPNFLERLFGFKERVLLYKETDRIYKYGGGNIYVTQDGRDSGNGNWIGKAIDRKKKCF